jgi:hypothetical protein
LFQVVSHTQTVICVKIESVHTEVLVVPEGAQNHERDRQVVTPTKVDRQGRWTQNQNAQPK